MVPVTQSNTLIGADGETSYCGIPFMSTRA
jgi:hypothetical protein